MPRGPEARRTCAHFGNRVGSAPVARSPSSWRVYAPVLLAPAAVVAAWWFLRGTPVRPAAKLTVPTKTVPERIVPLEFAGCRAVRTGPICTFHPEDVLTIWIDVPTESQAQVEIDGAEPEVTWKPVQGGLQGRVPLWTGANTLVVRRLLDEETQTSRLKLGPAADLRLVDEAKELRSKGKLDEALEKIQPWLDSEDPRRRVAARALQARIVRQKGDPERAIELLKKVVAEDRVLGLISEETDDRIALAFFVHAKTGRPDLAFDGLEPLREIENIYPEGAARLPYYRGHFAAESGDIATALRLLRSASRRSHRVANPVVPRAAKEVSARLLHRLGRHGDAAVLVEEMVHEPMPLDACRRAKEENNLAHALLDLRRADQKVSRHLPSPQIYIERAISAWSRACPSPRGLVVSLLTAAEFAYSSGDVIHARDYLARLRQVDVALGPYQLVDVLMLEAGLSLLESPELSLHRYDRLAETAKSAGLPFVVWEAHVERAIILREMGRSTEALDELEDAELLLEQWIRTVPLGEGRGRFMAARAKGTAAHIEVLLDMGKLSEALVVLRRSLRRSHQLLDLARLTANLSTEDRSEWNRRLELYRRARSQLDSRLRTSWRWSDSGFASGGTNVSEIRADAVRLMNEALSILPSSGYSNPGPVENRRTDQAILFLHPGLRGWLAFLVTASGTRLVRFDGVSNEELGERVATRIAGELPSQDELVVVAHSRAGIAGLDAAFHRTIADGDGMYLSYSLDLPSLEPAAALAEKDSLVVVGQGGQLENLVPEARWVERWLFEHQLRPIRLPSRGLGAKEDLLASIAAPGRTWLHFVGHAESRGLDGFDSALVVGESVRVSATDILGLNGVPGQVVLSGCDTGSVAGSEEGAFGLGLAHSFLLAGARAVVASLRPVEDLEALRFAKVLYSRDAEPDLEKMYRAARRSAVGNGIHRSGHEAFRLFTRTWERPQS